MKRLNGKSGSYNQAIGVAFRVEEHLNIEKRKIEAVGEEKASFERAIDAVREKLLLAKKQMDEKSGEIVEAEIALLEDPGFATKVKDLIESESVCAEYAVLQVGSELERAFAAMENEYMRERSADIAGLTKSLARFLTGTETVSSFPENTILVAEELTPEYVSTIDRNHVVGMISQKGSRTSHVAILCGNYGIPYVYGINIEEVPQGEEVAMDAVTGEVIVTPDEAEKKALLAKMQESEDADAGMDEQTAASLAKILFCANIGTPSEIDAVLQAKADGVGLFRTEFLFMNATLPSEEEQFEAYKKVAMALDGKEVIIRTMDIGADKKSPCMTLPPEENPALGKRAIRISLSDTALFRTQLRAIMRACVFGNISVMYPMITCVRELDLIQEQIRMAEQELKEAGAEYVVPKQGVMIETPSAAMMSDELSKKVDFFSIGTNDLTQYTLALDRCAQGLDDFYDPYSEAVMRLIGLTVKNAHANGVRVGICGELGGDVLAIPRLLALGVDELSMAPGKIKAAKVAARKFFESAQGDSEIAKLESTQGDSEIAKLENAQGDSEIAKGAGNSNAPKCGAMRGAEQERKQKLMRGAEQEMKQKLMRGAEFFSAPADGVAVAMKDIPDPAFSGGLLGKCMAVQPTVGKIYAPCDGTVTMVAQTYHAIGMTSVCGHEVLIHVGIDTVNLAGKGFDVHVAEGEFVQKGTLLMDVDLNVIQEAGLNDLVILAVQNA